jgi:hypothetical protein
MAQNLLCLTTIPHIFQTKFKKVKHADDLLKQYPSKGDKYVIDKELQHTDHLFLGVACFTFLNFVWKICGIVVKHNKFWAIVSMKILSAVKEGQQKCCETVYSCSGINHMWILKNSKDLLDNLKSRSFSQCPSNMLTMRNSSILITCSSE